MKHDKAQVTEKQNVPLWPEPAHGHLPAAPPPRGQEKEPPVDHLEPPARKRVFWRYLGLLVFGLCCYAVFIALASLAWGYTAFSQHGYISDDGLLAEYIFLGAIFLSSCLMTEIGRGGPIFPALLFAVLANTASFLLAELSAPPLNRLLIKLILSLLCAAAGFTLTKLLIMSGRQRKKSEHIPFDKLKQEKAL
jgi:hypothetical protein